MSKRGVPAIPKNTGDSEGGILPDALRQKRAPDTEGGIFPDALRQKAAPAPYVSPPTPINLELARREAPALAKHLRSAGKNYSRQSLRAFQAHAGITVDGIYGPLSASALRYFKVVNPPQPLFKPAPGSVVIYAPAN